MKMQGKGPKERNAHKHSAVRYAGKGTQLTLWYIEGRVVERKMPSIGRKEIAQDEGARYKVSEGHIGGRASERAIECLAHFEVGEEVVD